MKNCGFPFRHTLRTYQWFNETDASGDDFRGSSRHCRIDRLRAKMGPYRYSNGLRYRALAFNGKPGDRIGVWVHAQSGVPVAFLTDFNLNVLAGGMARFPAAIPPK